LEIFNRRVVLILDPKYGEEGSELRQGMPVWMVESAVNRPAIDAMRNAPESSLTTFLAKEGETPAMTCERVSTSLDDHYNESSQTSGYEELEVVGVPLSDVSTTHLESLGFVAFRPTGTGFVAKKVGDGVWSR
jgi:hypothetical protein